MSKTIVITSGKGGVGKTTATANLGSALALRDKKVVVIDTDIGLRNLDVVMGLENRIVYDLIDVIEGTCKLSQAMIRDKHSPELYLIPAPQTRDKTDIQPEQLRDLCEQLKKEHDYVLIDCPAGIEQGFRNAITAADEAILITTPEVSAIRDADRVIGLIEASELPPPNLILNRVRPSMVRSGDMMDKDDVVSLLSVRILGIVPDDSQIIVSTNRGMPVVHDPKSWSGEAFRRVAARMEGIDMPFLEMYPKRGIWSKLKGFVSLNGKEG